MQSILATGGTFQKRQEYIKNKLQTLAISRFDQYYVNADNSVKIEQIRKLTQQLSRKPIQGKARAGIILAAEKATIEAQNALLKLLEEPPKTVYLFLSAPNPQHLLPTVTSRCRIIRVHHDAPLLDGQTEKEMRKIFNKICRGGARPHPITGDHKGRPYKIAAAFELAEKLSKNRQKTDQFLQDGLLYIRNQYLKESAEKKPSFKSSTPGDSLRETPGVKSSALRNAARIARKLLLSRRLISANVNPRQVLENLFLDL